MKAGDYMIHVLLENGKNFKLEDGEEEGGEGDGAASGAFAKLKGIIAEPASS